MDTRLSEGQTSRASTMRGNPHLSQSQQVPQPTFRYLPNPIPMSTHSPDRSPPPSSRNECTVSPVLSIKKQQQQSQNPRQPKPYPFTLPNTLPSTSISHHVSIQHHNTPKSSSNINKTIGRESGKTPSAYAGGESHVELEVLREENTLLKSKIKQFTTGTLPVTILPNSSNKKNFDSSPVFTHRESLAGPAVSELKKIIVELAESQYVKENSYSSLVHSVSGTPAKNQAQLELLNKLRSLQIQNQKLAEMLQKKQSQKNEAIDQLSQVNARLVQQIRVLRSQNYGSATNSNKAAIIKIKEQYLDNLKTVSQTLAQEFQKMVSKYENNIHALTLNKMDEYNSRLDHMEQLLQLRAGTLLSTRQKRAEKDLEVVYLEETMGFETRELSRVRSQLRLSREQYQRLLSAQTRLEEQRKLHVIKIDQIVHENQVLREVIATKQKILLNQQAKFDQLTQDLEEHRQNTLKRFMKVTSEDQVQTSRISSDSLERENLIKEKAVLSSELAATQSAISKLNTQLQTYQAEISDLKSRHASNLQSLKQEIEGLRDQTTMVPELKQRILTLERQLLVNEQKTNELVGELSDARAQIKQLEAVFEKRDSQVVALKELVQSVANKITQYQTTIKGLKGQLSQQSLVFTKTLQQSNARAAEIQKRLKESHKIIQQLEDRNQNLTNQLNEIASKITALDSQELDLVQCEEIVRLQKAVQQIQPGILLVVSNQPSEA